MGYRKITVDDTQYEYVVGKTHLKIKGRQAVPVSEVGAQVSENVWAVTPARVASYIKLGYVPADAPAPNILLESSVAKMKKIAKNRDYECAHIAADNLLCEVLDKLGYSDLTKAYYEVNKWYA